MLKFFLGMVVGAILVVVIGVLIIAGIASMRSRPPAVASDSTLILRLDGDLPERAPVELPFEGFGQHTPLTVADTWAILRRAAVDKRIRAIVLEPQNLAVGWAKMQELHAELDNFRKSGKPVYAYLKTPSARDYYVATAASKVYLGPQDLLNLKGVRFELMYFKKTLDKLGITVDVEHDGKYKDFGDMFTRSDMSPETREVMTSIVDRVYGDLVKTIGVSRKKSAAEVEDAINNGPLLSSDVAARGLVDSLCYEDEMFGKLRREINTEVRKVDAHDYLQNGDFDAGLKTKDKIGFVVAEGDIIRGEPGSSNETEIQSESFTKLLDKVSNRSDLKGVIVRIDSPGGEVYATDAIWKSMNDLARKKPVVISMSDAAASGGYYIAMNGTPIVAYPETLTGSIGVVYGKPDLHGLYDKLGISKDSIQRGHFAGIDSDYKPLTPEEKEKLKQGIDATYQTFLRRVSDSRKRPVDQIALVAEGRVWLGDQAKENGLVDELGGIDRAIELVKQRARIAPYDTVSLVTFPPRKTLFDLLFNNQSPDASIEARIRMALGIPQAVTLPPVFAAPQVRAFLHGGYLSVCPWVLSIN
ncbi:signal peptide peptidase SppA [Nevskia soli]|uniref:signal peptide peptidase SppA n=1 Tax=Nevskia soli TaxID=418856 RepID=UPI0015D76CB7|nr:signal peptide peptidase SppA [Nevskia soli]